MSKRTSTMCKVTVKRQLTNVKKLVTWGTDGRLPLIGDFRCLILE